MREWITAAEAALLAQRDVSRVYRWIREGRLVATENAVGTLLVKAKEVLELDQKMTRRKNNKKRR